MFVSEFYPATPVKIADVHELFTHTIYFGDAPEYAPNLDIVAAYDRGLVGAIATRVYERQRVIRIEHLASIKKGIGTALINKVALQGMRDGYESLTVEAKYDAKPYYENYGFYTPGSNPLELAYDLT